MECSAAPSTDAEPVPGPGDEPLQPVAPDAAEAGDADGAKLSPSEVDQVLGKYDRTLLRRLALISRYRKIVDGPVVPVVTSTEVRAVGHLQTLRKGFTLGQVGALAMRERSAFVVRPETTWDEIAAARGPFSHAPLSDFRILYPDEPHALPHPWGCADAELVALRDEVAEYAKRTGAMWVTTFRSGAASPYDVLVNNGPATLATRMVVTEGRARAAERIRRAERAYLAAVVPQARALPRKEADTAGQSGGS